MPIYAYRCEACGSSRDALQKISDAPLTQCAECGASALKKQVTSAGFQLKGSGWYQTDFRNSGAGPTKSSSSSAETSNSGELAKSADNGAGKSKSDSASADKPAAAPTASTTGGGSSESAKPAARAPGGGWH